MKKSLLFYIGDANDFKSSKDKFVSYSFGNNQMLFSTIGKIVNSAYFIALDGYIINPENSSLLAEEDIIEQFREKGPEFISELEGSFTLVLVDIDNKNTYCYTDKFPTRELLYCNTENGFAVSNIAADFFEYLPIKKELNYRKVFTFVGAHYRHHEEPIGETFFNNVYSLAKGSYIHRSLNGIDIRKYWDLNLLDLSNKGMKQIQEEYLHLIENAITSRVKIFSNPAFTLSSGMDSSTVSYFGKKVLGKGLELYTTTFDVDTIYDESKDIAETAKPLGNWNTVQITASALNSGINKVFQRCNSPFSTVTQMLHFNLSEIVAEKGHDVLFSGLGGDEANCGEVEEYLCYFADLQLRRQYNRMKKEMAGWIEYHGTKEYPKTENTYYKYAASHIDWAVPGHNLCELSRRNEYFSAFDVEFRTKYETAPHMEYRYNSYVRNRLYQDLFYEAIPCVLKAERYSSLLCNIETCYPYMDSKVMQYGFSIPLDLKYKDGINKWPIREAMSGKLPKSATHNYLKRGWNAPFEQWLINDFQSTINHIIDSPDDRQNDMYNGRCLKAIYDEHVSKKANHMGFFWRLVSFENWFKTNF